MFDSLLFFEHSYIFALWRGVFDKTIIAAIRRYSKCNVGNVINEQSIFQWNKKKKIGIEVTGKQTAQDCVGSPGVFCLTFTCHEWHMDLCHLNVLRNYPIK